MASGPAIAKNATVAMKVMRVEVAATGSGTPYRRMVYIIIGPAPDCSGVTYAAQALIPPARIIPFSGGSGYASRATTQSRIPPPNQSIDASPTPTSNQPQCSRPRADVKAGRLFP